MNSEILFFTIFTATIVGILLLDLGVFSKDSHKVSFKEAAIWSAVWVILSLSFYGFLEDYGEKVHGINSMPELYVIAEKYAPDLKLPSATDYEENVEFYREHIALEYITGYLLEYSLSADNIFVIILIFTSFQVSERFYKKVLFWGIMGAIIMRFMFIFIGSALIQEFHWILYIFGVFLVYTGVKMFLGRNDEDEKINPDKHPIVRFASKHFPVFPRFIGQNFFVRYENKLYITPLFLVLVIIEFTDLVFAVDSVPAVFAVTRDPYIVFFSNIFAILGLRSMFFFLANVLHLFHYLKVGLALLLTFIGSKMLLHDWLKANGFENYHSLIVILSILGISIVASLLFPKKEVSEQKV